MVLGVLTLLIVPAASGEEMAGPLWSIAVGGGVTSTAVTTDGSLTVAGTRDAGSVRIFDENGTEVWNYPTGCPVYQVSISGDGRFVAAASDKVRLFDRNGQIISNFDTGFFAYSTALSADGNYLAAGYDDSTIALYTAGGQEFWTAELDDDAVSLSLSSDGSYLAAGSKDERLYFFDNRGVPLWSYETGKTVMGVSVSPEGEYVAAGSLDKVIYFLDQEGVLLWRYIVGERVFDVSVSAGGKYVAAAAGTGLLLLDREGNLVWRYDAGNTVQGAAITPDGRRIALGVGSGAPAVHFLEGADVPDLAEGSESPDAWSLRAASDPYLMRAFIMADTGEVPTIAHDFDGVSIAGIVREEADPATPVTVRLTVGPEWTAAHGGQEGVVIVAARPDSLDSVPSLVETIPTSFVGYDPEGRLVFEGRSPYALTAYGIIAASEKEEGRTPGGGLVPLITGDGIFRLPLPQTPPRSASGG
ncbi:WD40 repeat domain-containing protein [Methanofollis tationis]|uniref:WD40 repeat domain-containing protein n=1 Tax=Methanofollis tationis TaxID=81417 RepID=A0A7K4HMH7_9EURY|nr:WD40 repeat domain-containing protein [Methanofollis tationis]NVO66466.1 WD40 repeat domain-containing protein [Methanofollis tationis]